MKRELTDLRQRVSSPMPIENKTDNFRVRVSTYSDNGSGCLHLIRWFCEVNISMRLGSCLLSSHVYVFCKLTE
ncbi:hypothetical protein F442_08167 [Phytophthora nicotianae P10297]|uniref:Uncharacterized protein n=1 Tax=Phytophthora nicotianae P10297 TaxID=1317064 RepID=W2ZGY5_PHYNI|nr:hypothetical protein F442_08167 [Phytophthora nicotianae P10297]